MIVGNEPNLNRFWLPQFDDGGQRRRRPGLLRPARRRRTTLSRRPTDDVTVWGGALAPRGIDRPGTGRDTHSPTTFIRDLGAAFRASGRERATAGRLRLPPVPGQLEHPARPADRPGVDVDPARGLRGEAPAAAGRGVRRRPARPLQRARCRDGDPGRRRRPLYEGEEPGEPVDEATQAEYYRRAIELAACQQNVEGCSSSTPTTSRRSPASSPASTTSTGRRRRASSPSARRSANAGALMLRYAA